MERIDEKRRSESIGNTMYFSSSRDRDDIHNKTKLGWQNNTRWFGSKDHLSLPHPSEKF
jgi:hypothetical protein